MGMFKSERLDDFIRATEHRDTEQTRQHQMLHDAVKELSAQLRAEVDALDKKIDAQRDSVVERHAENRRLILGTGSLVIAAIIGAYIALPGPAPSGDSAIVKSVGKLTDKLDTLIQEGGIKRR